jgi:hypothetical protein
VTFFGKIEQEFLDSYYAECDLVVMPSRYESFGLVLLEAMMCGLPVVAARVGGMKEVVVDGETGFLPPPGDVDAFAEAVVLLGSDARLRKRFGENGRRRFEERFTARTMAERSVEMYRRLLNEKRQGRLGYKRIRTPKAFPLCRPWTLSDFWNESPLKSWVDREWFFPSVPGWISLLAREAIYRNGASSEPKKTIVVGSSEPSDFIESLFPNALKIGRIDLDNRGIWADSSVVSRPLYRLGLPGEAYDAVVVLKPLPQNLTEQIAAVNELARVLRTSGVLAFVTEQPIRMEVVFRLKTLGFQTGELETLADRAPMEPAGAYSAVVTRTITPNLALGPFSKHLTGVFASSVE